MKFGGTQVLRHVVSKTRIPSTDSRGDSPRRHIGYLPHPATVFSIRILLRGWENDSK